MTVTAGETFNVGLQARNGGGEESNTPHLELDALSGGRQR